MTKSLGIFLCLAVAADAFSIHQQAATRFGSTALSMAWFNPGGDKKKSPVAKQEDTTVVSQKKKKKKNDDWIKNMFTPVHGGGSAKQHDLDDIYAAQQRILADRRKNLDPKTLQSKYKTVGEDHLRDIETIKHDPKSLNQKEDDAMYIDQDHDKKTSFLPWMKKLKP